MTSEIKENKINTSNKQVTHLEFVGDRTSDYNHELSVFGENITLLENFLESACNKQKTSYTLSLRSLKIIHYSRLSDNKILCVLRSYPNITSLNFEQTTDIVIDEIVQHCSSLEFLGIQSTNVSKDALSKLNPKIKINRDSVLNIGPENELNDLWVTLVNLVQHLWLTYANLEDIVQYYKDKIKDEHYQKSIVELERNMKSMAERFSLMPFC
ncbi:6155_t:CDS:2 [Rhizophagus irregularis]|nr:6155_t:CDS:2 [Rhizophagus irregularis]